MTLRARSRTIGITSCRNVGRARRFPTTRYASMRPRSISDVILDDRTERTDTETVDNSRAIGELTDLPGTTPDGERPQVSHEAAAIETRKRLADSPGCATSRRAVRAPLAPYVAFGDECDRDPVLAGLLCLQPNRGHRPPQRRRGAEHAPPVESPIDARQLLDRPGGVLSPVLAQAAFDSLESGSGGELLQEPASGLAGGQLEVHLRAGRSPRSTRAPPHDSGATRRRDDALSRGDPIPGHHGRRGATGSGAANSCDSAASDSRRDRGDARRAAHRPVHPADL